MVDQLVAILEGVGGAVASVTVFVLLLYAMVHPCRTLSRLTSIPRKLFGLSSRAVLCCGLTASAIIAVVIHRHRPVDSPNGTTLVELLRRLHYVWWVNQQQLTMCQSCDVPLLRDEYDHGGSPDVLLCEDCRAITALEAARRERLKKEVFGQNFLSGTPEGIVPRSAVLTDDFVLYGFCVHRGEQVETWYDHQGQRHMFGIGGRNFAVTDHEIAFEITRRLRPTIWFDCTCGADQDQTGTGRHDVWCAKRSNGSTARQAAAISGDDSDGASHR